MARLQSRQHGDGEDLLVVQNSKDLKGHLIEDASDYVKLGLLSTLLYSEVPFVIAIVTATEQTTILPMQNCCVYRMRRQV